MKRLIFLSLAMVVLNCMVFAQSTIWSPEKANEWYARQPWICGANFIPSTAINQLEMWQAATFDPATIDRELGYAQGIGMNAMRVYLHSQAWLQDKTGFLKRVDEYLQIADKHKIRTIFVFFDDCWDKQVKTGVQHAPVPGTHNSGWVQDPGGNSSADTMIFPMLRQYVTSVIGRFRTDKRILLWDLYNEPGNSGKGDSSLVLLSRVFEWARMATPEQPVSSAIWDFSQINLNTFQIRHSDVITYHDYEAPAWHTRVLELLKVFGKPIICTEYMARTQDSRFTNILPILKKNNVGAINWGLVAGKTNTIYAWRTVIADGSEPAEWFHDIFRKNGTPYKKEETDLISKLTAQK